MSVDRTLGISQRIVVQMLRDHRSLALIIVAPLVVMTLVGLSLSDQRSVLDRVAPALVATFALFFTFVLTGVSFLRERAQGTLERLLTTPVRRSDLLVGYMLGFLVFAVVQSLVILFFTIFALDVSYQGSLWQVFILLLVLTVVAVSVGILISTFARNEFQVVQFIPLVFAPQVFLSGVILPVEEMPWYLEAIARALPLTYAVEGLQDTMLRGHGIGEVLKELGVLGAFAVALLALAAGTIRRT